ncbi:hypothetical protein [Bacillus nitratireducens]|uniref:hypothetical protein n=1 Tax=Bacillus nitratireducens TaxID=2026193 RepID=UPI00089D179C|nr:hypothetical protein [Bacillus nitratireducens]SEA91497.1 hypothetical protein SAMN04488146_104419 [Bacillus nitratireducens]
MTFESKYLIRWGIPGWVLILWIAYAVLLLKGINPVEADLSQMSKSLGLLVSLAAVGVPLGYVMHQLYFGAAWVMNQSRNFDEIKSITEKKYPKKGGWGKDKNDDYFHCEFVWHMVLLNQDSETRTYIEGRYRHLLGTTHALGSLLISSSIALLITALIVLTHLSSFVGNYYFWIGLIIQLAVFLASMVNYKYYSDNVRVFQLKMLKKYI